jgi:hypothetical protein
MQIPQSTWNLRQPADFKSKQTCPAQPRQAIRRKNQTSPTNRSTSEPRRATHTATSRPLTTRRFEPTQIREPTGGGGGADLEEGGGVGDIVADKPLGGDSDLVLRDGGLGPRPLHPLVPVHLGCPAPAAAWSPGGW